MPPSGASRQGQVLVENLVRKFGEPIRQEAAQPEELQFLGSFLAAANLSQIIELSLDGSLTEVHSRSSEMRNGFRRGKRE